MVQADQFIEGIRLLCALAKAALLIYAFVVVIRNRAWCRFLWPFGLVWAGLAVGPLLCQMPFLPSDRAGLLFTGVLVQVAVTTVAATAGTFLWLELGYRPFPFLWRRLARWWGLPAEEALVSEDYLSPRRRPEPLALAVICAGSIGLTLALLGVAGARPDRPQVAAADQIADALAEDTAASPPEPEDEARYAWRDLPKAALALLLVAFALDEEIVCRLLALAVALGLCRRWRLPGHAAVLTVAFWWALGQWGAGLVPAWVVPLHALAFGTLAGYLMVFVGLEACVVLQLCLALCSPLLWVA